MLTIPTRRILIFGFLAFVLIGLEQGILGLFVAELGAQLHRSPEELGLFLPYTASAPPSSRAPHSSGGWKTK